VAARTGEGLERQRRGPGLPVRWSLAGDLGDWQKDLACLLLWRGPRRRHIDRTSPVTAGDRGPTARPIIPAPE
jgi:hypothetical protein